MDHSDRKLEDELAVGILELSAPLPQPYSFLLINGTAGSDRPAGGDKRLVDRLGAVFPVARSGADAPGPIPRRVAALLAPPPPRRLALLAIVLALTLLAGVCALEAANELQDLLSLASSY